MTKEKLKQILAGLGVGALTIGGIMLWLTEQPTPSKNMTYQEYLDLLKAYNTKIEYIKQNCDTDKRCLKDKGEPRVLMNDIKTKEDAVNKLNEWLKTEDSVFVK